MKDLTKGNPAKLIISFAIPVFLARIFQLCYSLADTRIVGELVGKEAIAAVGAASSMSNMLIGFLFGITSGFGIIVARRFGEQNEKKMKKSIASSLTLSIVITLIIMTIALVFLRPILQLLHTPDELFDSSYSYIRIILFGMIASTLYNFCSAILRAIGDTVSPLIFLIISVTMNVGLDLLFIGSFHLGVQGAAYGTVISQSVSAVLCIIYMVIRYPQLKLNKDDFCMEKTLNKQLMQSGMSMGLMNSLVSLGTVALQSSINTFGTNIIVAHTGARKITEIFMLMFAIFGTTMATYTSQNMGAGKISRIKKGLRFVLIVSWCWIALTILASFFISPWLIYLVTKVKEPEVIKNASLYLRINSCFYFVTAMITIFRNTLQGIGDHITPIISSFIELVGKVLIVVLLTPRLHYFGIIISEPIVWFFMVIPLIVQIVRNPIMRGGDFDVSKEMEDGMTEAILESATEKEK